MSKLLQPFFDKFIIIYLDDIVVYSETLEEQGEHLQQVFQVLRENELCQERKVFARQEIPFLGHILSKGQVKIDQVKIQVILGLVPLSKVAELQSSLELANYYGRFIY